MSNCYLVDTDIIIYWLKDIFPQINKKIKKIENDKTEFEQIMNYSQMYRIIKKEETISKYIYIYRNLQAIS